MFLKKTCYYVLVFLASKKEHIVSGYRHHKKSLASSPSAYGKAKKKTKKTIIHNNLLRDNTKARFSDGYHGIVLIF